MSAALNVFLQPFTQILERLDVREICVNQPGNMYVQTHCDWQLVQDKALTFHKLKQLSQLIANYTGQDISENTPLLSASLPAGERIQIMLPPSTEPGFIAFSIRKHQVMNLTLEDAEEEFEGKTEKVGKTLLRGDNILLISLQKEESEK